MGIKNKKRQSLPLKAEESAVMETDTEKVVPETAPASGLSRLLLTNIKYKADENELVQFIKSTSNAQIDDIQICSGPYVVLSASKENAAKILKTCNGQRFNLADLNVASIDAGSVHIGKSTFDPDTLTVTKVIKVVGNFDNDQIVQMAQNASKTSSSKKHVVFEMPSLEASKTLFEKLLKYKKLKNLKFKIFYERERSTEGLSSTNKLMLYNVDLDTKEDTIKSLVPDATLIIRNISLFGSYYLEFADSAKCKENLGKLHNLNLGDRLMRAELFNNDYKLKIFCKPHVKNSAQAKEIFPEALNNKVIAGNKGPIVEFTFKNRDQWVDAIEKVRGGRIGNHTVWTAITKIEQSSKNPVKAKEKKTPQVIKSKKGLVQAGSSDEEDNQEGESESKPSKMSLLKRPREDSEDDDDGSDEADSDDEDPDLEDEEDSEDRNNDDDDEDDDESEDDDEDDDESEGEKAPKLIEPKKALPKSQVNPTKKPNASHGQKSGKNQPNKKFGGGNPKFQNKNKRFRKN